MANPEQRLRVYLGDLYDPDAPRHAVRRLEDKSVKDAIVSYLELKGVVLDRRNPRGWFLWADPPKNSIFITRCSDPPALTAPDDKWQPWHYFIEAEINEQGEVIATDFYHEDFLNSSSGIEQRESPG
jgi:hypothetical protein